jgi:polyhydroxyalkanoate synthesis regulator phasin
MSDVRRIVRYRNRKLYEAKERRFVTLEDLAKAVSTGARVEVIAADTGEDITARVLSRALASGKSPVSASADTLARILRAGSEAAETVAGAAERVGATAVAASLRKASQPEKLGQTLAPLTRKIEDARQDIEKIVGSLVEKGRLTWEEGARLRDDVGLVFRESLSDLTGSVRDLGARLGTSGQHELAREVAEIKARLAQLESLARKSFPETRHARPAAKTGRASASSAQRRRTR